MLEEAVAAARAALAGGQKRVEPADQPRHPGADPRAEYVPDLAIRMQPLPAAGRSHQPRPRSTPSPPNWSTGSAACQSRPSSC
jgi:hypothetical protein